MINMIVNKIQNQRGIALIQILLITAILTVFALYLTRTARQQVKMASWSQDRARAEVELYSAEAELMFSLLTENKFYLPSDAEQSPIIQKWNFHGQHFNINPKVDVSIQDQAGLINLHYLHLGNFRKLLISNGVSLERALQIGDRLYDWQDTDSIARDHGFDKKDGFRNGKIPDITEIERIFELSELEKKLIFDNTGIFYVGDLNPLTASKELISALSNKVVAQQVQEQRQNSRLTVNQFKSITGIIETNDMRFYPSNMLSVIYTVSVNEAVLTREMVISLSPYAKKGITPFNILLDRS